ncbi:hypothetical protein HDU89_004106 [Geranomyces variabilis]|nr:hypothetical protein HDU89_004106 [Geranomyces variabilis]
MVQILGSPTPATITGPAVVDSIANALFVDTASAAAAFEVEADTKQPSIRILSDIVAFLGTNLTFAMELAHHLGNGENLNAKIGVARSDFAITSFEVKDVIRAGAAFLIAEFAAGADAHPIRKDTFVATAEAVFESHRIVAHLDIDSVPLGRVHILLGSDRKLKFGVVQPIDLPGGIFREHMLTVRAFAVFVLLLPDVSSPSSSPSSGNPANYEITTSEVPSSVIQIYPHQQLAALSCGQTPARPQGGRVRVNPDDEGTGTTEAHDSKGEYPADSNCNILIQPLDSYGDPATQITFGFPSTAAFIVLLSPTARPGTKVNRFC